MRTHWTLLAASLLLPVWASAAARKGPAPVPIRRPVLPADLVLSEATATATVGDTVAKVALKVGIEALGEKPQEMLLLPPDVALTEFSFGRTRIQGVALVRTDAGYVLRTRLQGVYALDAEYVLRVEKTDETHALTLPLVPAAKAVTELTLPGASMDVTFAPEVSYESKQDADKTVLTIYGAAERQVRVTWQPTLAPKKAEAVVFADQNAKVSVGRGVLRLDTTIDYTILQGKLDQLAVALPADATLLSVKGESLRTWDIETDGAQRTLKAQLLSAVADKYTLELQLEQAIAKAQLAKPASFVVPAVAAANVERETGAVAILVWKGLKVEPVKTEGVTQVDVREMPPAFQALKEQVHLAYRYLQRPFTIEAAVSEVAAKVSANVLTAIRVSPESLRFSSQIDYLIKDAGIFRLSIRLGQDVKLLDLEGENINNYEREADTLVVDLRSKAEGPYHLTLETAQAIAAAQDTVDVAAIQLLEVARERGHLALSADPGIKVEPVTADNITQIDVGDLPKTAPKGNPKGKAKANPTPLRADLAFRYLRHPHTLRIAISKVEAEVAATVHTAVEVDEKHADTTASIQYDIRKAGIFQLQVALPQGFRLLGCDGQSIDDWKVADDTLTVALKQKTEGSYTLKLTGKSDVGDLSAVPLPVFKAVGAEKETGFVAVRADQSLRVKTSKTEGLAEIDVKELPATLQAGTGKVLLAFKYFAQPWSGVLAAEAIDPHVTAETFTFLSLGEALLQASVTVRYTVLYAGVQTFRIQLPDNATNVDFKGEEIKHREEDKANHTWTITLQAKRTERYDLYVTYEQKVAGQTIDLQYEGLTVLDVTRETGYIAVAARADLELSTGDKLEALTPIDPQEVPAAYKAGITVPLLVAFRYLKHPYTLHAIAAKHDPADVLVAVIEVCLLSTTLTEDGNLITDMTCRVRNTREQNLAIALPEDAELWHVFVDGKRAIPVQSTDGDTVWTKVPIAGVGDGARAFAVQLRYSRAASGLSSFGVLAFDFPRMAIPAMRLGWQIALPDGYRLIRHGGSLRHVDHLDSELVSLARIQAPAGAALAATPPPAKTQTAWRNYNEQAQSNLSQLAGVSKGGRASGQRSMYTGTRPDTANVHYYQSLIAMKRPGTIRSVYFRDSADRVFQGLLVLGAIAAVLALWVRRPHWSQAWRVATVLAVALIVLGLRTLGEDSYRAHATCILWTLVLTPFAVLAWQRVRPALKARAQRAPAAAPPELKQAHAPEPPPLTEPADQPSEGPADQAGEEPDEQPSDEPHDEPAEDADREADDEPAEDADEEPTGGDEA